VLIPLGAKLTGAVVAVPCSRVGCLGASLTNRTRFWLCKDCGKLFYWLFFSLTSMCCRGLSHDRERKQKFTEIEK